MPRYRFGGPSTVYRLFDANGRLLYVGVTQSASQRLRQHSAYQWSWQNVASATFQHFPNRAEAEEAEARAIRTEGPLHNGVNNPAFYEKRRVEAHLAWATQRLTEVQAKVASLPPDCHPNQRGALLAWMRKYQADIREAEARRLSLDGQEVQG